MSDEFSPGTVRRAVRELRPEWTVRDAREAERDRIAERHRRAVRELVG